MRLPDALLVRAAQVGSGQRERQYDGQAYLAVSVWGDADAAREALAAIRSQGRRARITKEIRPRRARASERKTTVYAPRRDRRYMWVVWEEAAS